MSEANGVYCISEEQREREEIIKSLNDTDLEGWM